MASNQIKITTKILNCRKSPSIHSEISGNVKFGEVYDIFNTKNGWGQLENGLWINLHFTTPYYHKIEEVPNFHSDPFSAQDIIKNTSSVQQIKKEPTIIKSNSKTNSIKLVEKEKTKSLMEITGSYNGKVLTSSPSVLHSKQLNDAECAIFHITETLEQKEPIRLIEQFKPDSFDELLKQIEIFELNNQLY